MKQESVEHENRLSQIKASLQAEWRLKTEHGIHHDHLSDLAFLITELEYTQARLTVALAKLKAES